VDLGLGYLLEELAGEAGEMRIEGPSDA